MRPGEDRGRRVADRHDDEADGVGRDAGHRGELAVGDDRPGGVAHGGKQHLAVGQQAAPAGAGAGEQRDTGEPDGDARRAGHGHPVTALGAGQPAEHRADGRHGSDEQAAGRTGQMAFGGRQERPRPGDLDDRVGGEPPPVPEQHGPPLGPPRALRQRDGDQDERAHDDPRPDQHGHGDLGVRDLDQQVRDPPDDTHRGEQGRATPAQSPPAVVARGRHRPGTARQDEGAECREYSVTRGGRGPCGG